jgi:pimeloyl-ACP methyl ester carboxylesterase
VSARSRLGNDVPSLVSAAVLVLAVAACASPTGRWWDHVADAGFDGTVVAGDPFRHAVLEKPGRPSRVLHVYLDGDGTPWHARGPAADPTPRSMLVLDLMRLDDHPSLYLGRPCYHGLVEDPGCRPALWTSQRYSDLVVSSMAAGLTRSLRERGFDRLAFIGYSGGGSLAVLLAARFPQTSAVVTVAANLDIDAWTARHGYLRLAGSLNPAAQPPLPRHVYQRHYVGGRDRNVPREIVSSGRFDPSGIVLVPDFDHACCWRRLWPSIIADLHHAMGAS